MIDFILLTFIGGVFCGGFWCGKTYLTVAAMKDRLVSFIK